MDAEDDDKESKADACLPRVSAEALILKYGKA
jgi:hypothetical protein